ncbi:MULTISPECIES: biotin/lipoyl-binding carrier protein [Microbaculum]|uniref:Biotin/lipoyl-binding carrier protein n=1 Tax=Microbaculum marinisediminis TaxID=2931392 RepID=A0AAW5QTX8_9HYPH|nr:biotin/lipoyl-binding carrier protein [Microbaculum sp. A6E488]MCT8971501.1 biotin/lipoyl-binding carrier protein [Microbaculum sp. A6E488]
MADIEVKSDIAGAVWKLLVQPGTEVEEDDTVVILESMKMEIPISAPESGTVKSVAIAEGDAVVEGQLVLVLTV